MSEAAFCDSNVLLYLFDDDSLKKAVASKILNEGVFIHPQVVCESSQCAEKAL